jgi:uncharacterized protein (DUF697 family)
LSLGVLKDIRKIYAGLNANEVREASEREVRIGLLATSDAVYRDMEDFLVPAHLDPQARSQALQTITRLESLKGTAAQDFDVLLCEPGVGLPRNGYLFDPASVGSNGGDEALIECVVEENQAIELALARAFPVFRKSVAHRIIGRISRENATLALLTALPNVLPSFIELPWAVGEFATDTAFLTMNQIRMALMMAAVYDRPVGYSEQKASIAGIAAGAFGWRAIARELVGKIPLGGGLIPKAAIAYAGTWVVGTGLDRLYRTGIGFSRAERREAWTRAITRGREIASDLHNKLPNARPAPGE